MKILFAASEAVPFCKTGGLADVAGSLPQVLKRMGHDVRLVLPKYAAVDRAGFGLKPLGLNLLLPVGDAYESASLWEGRLAGKVPVYFVDAPKYFEREGLYRDASGRDFPDNDERFILFSRAVLEAAKAVDFRPDVVHCHDWQTGLIPAYLETVYRLDAFFLPTASVFTVHNIAYQGLFPKNTLFLAGFSWSDFTPDRLEYFDQVNFLKAGLVFSHALNTVSPGYAREVQSDEAFGRGMEGLLRKRSSVFTGILNGLDPVQWNPEKDPHIAKKFSSARPGGKRLCKADLQSALGLARSPEAPLLGMVSRLDPQKGVDIALMLVGEESFKNGAQAVFMGQGEPEYQDALVSLTQKFPGQAAYISEFSEPLAHKVYAGADIFLMPSRFEPCGLGQMIALRYGAVPVVTPTGGLRDTVAPCRPGAEEGVGFVASETSLLGFRRALGEAVSFFREKPDAWERLIARGMAARFRWEDSAERYAELYGRAVAAKRGHAGPAA